MDFKALGIMLVLSLFLAGCVTNSADTQKIAALESQVTDLNAKCAAAEADAKGLQTQVDSLKGEKRTCDGDLATVKDQLAAAQAALEDSSSGGAGLRSTVDAFIANDTSARALEKYKEMDNYACLYYLGIGGYLTGGNVTLPMGCAIVLGDYVVYSRTALNTVKDYKTKLAASNSS